MWKRGNKSRGRLFLYKTSVCLLTFSLAKPLLLKLFLKQLLPASPPPPPPPNWTRLTSPVLLLGPRKKARTSISQREFARIWMWNDSSNFFKKKPVFLGEICHLAQTLRKIGEGGLWVLARPCPPYQKGINILLFLNRQIASTHCSSQVITRSSSGRVRIGSVEADSVYFWKKRENCCFLTVFFLKKI